VTAADRFAFDASVLVRSAVDPAGEAARLVASVDRLEVEGHTASLAFAESANALLGYVRAGSMSVADAGETLASLRRVPFLVHGHELVEPALYRAFGLGLSAYDGTYAALAESTGAILVTADRRLAAAVENAMLVA
jgi:predicted nucleic acid-binding protein